MSRGLIFWVLMLVWLVFGVLGVSAHWPRDSAGFIPLGGTLLEFLLLGLLGWHVFGPAIKG